MKQEFVGSAPTGTRRIIRNAICDSTMWDGFVPRSDDIIIVTPGKTGTTWTQQIVGQFVLPGQEGFLATQSTWLDHNLRSRAEAFATLEQQTHRRFIKTHLPFDALPWSRSVRYIYVARDLRDQIWSIHNHLRALSDYARSTYNDRPCRVGPGLAGPPDDVRSFYLRFLETGSPGMMDDGGDPWPFWDHLSCAWALRHAPNVLLVHYARLKADLEGEMRRIAAFLDVEIDETALPAMMHRCSFDYMQSVAAKSEFLGKFFAGGGRTFVHKGENGRWRDVLSAEEAARCDALAETRLGKACAHWVSTGEMD